MDALSLDLIPWAAKRKMVEQTRHAHMIELVTRGTVPLTDIAQIDGILDPLPPLDRLPLLRRIEQGRRKDDQALGIIAKWRLLRQQPVLRPISSAGFRLTPTTAWLTDDLEQPSDAATRVGPNPVRSKDLNCPRIDRLPRHMWRLARRPIVRRQRAPDAGLAYVQAS